MAALASSLAVSSRVTMPSAAVMASSGRLSAASSFAPSLKASFGCAAPSSRVVMAAAAAGKDKPREGSKEPAQETLLTPRFYTTDFDEMEALFNREINPYVNQVEFDACLEEFRADYNQTHFVRSPEFKEAADKIQGRAREIFVEFLERSCTAEFSGFLLYKELGRRLKKTNPCIAEIFTLMSRDEARHAGFLNKALSDFNLSLDLGFLTKARKYTFFKPQYILYATFLSEKIGYWRYITICRHLNANPEFACYPIFGKFENWCQDENRHGDFITAMLKCYPKFLTSWDSKLWARFFCLSVYVTMYLNDHQRAAFYNNLGLDVKQFDLHVIKETNKTSARIFPAVLDTENPEFERKLDHLVQLHQSIIDADASTAPDLVKRLQKLPLQAAFVGELLAMYLMTPVDSGSVEFADNEPRIVY
ncbi:hypothetical protein CLOM_g16801 [Closterium sp. NIES-68]|nr:hypothetical protein CLOM_g16801 [Closterium sp. NIES-68]GJP75594.1 hypothetical protein CLOP_g6024 [Closterium sp. NIES-67]